MADQVIVRRSANGTGPWQTVAEAEASGGGGTLAQVLTAGNDATGQDITGVGHLAGETAEFSEDAGAQRVVISTGPSDPDASALLLVIKPGAPTDTRALAQFLNRENFNGLVVSQSGSVDITDNSSNPLLSTSAAGGLITLAGAAGTSAQIGTDASVLIGFHGANPVDQAAHINDPSGGGTQDAEARAAIGSILNLLEEKGLMAT